MKPLTLTLGLITATLAVPAMANTTLNVFTAGDDNMVEYINEFRPTIRGHAPRRYRARNGYRPW